VPARASGFKSPFGHSYAGTSATQGFPWGCLLHYETKSATLRPAGSISIPIHHGHPFNRFVTSGAAIFELQEVSNSAGRETLTNNWLPRVSP
jgi:hypothetical protein